MDKINDDEHETVTEDQMINARLSVWSIIDNLRQGRKDIEIKQTAFDHDKTATLWPPTEDEQAQVR